ncbi:RHS repeat domain-containing protein, partial [Bacteroides acidifaciens]|uniref:RHS repeat domain-containing protein n=1 Tax=Bacteroides acidifaciens TaxID=85831 RepID=UPI0025A9F7F8
NGTALTSTDFSTSYGYDLNCNITQISRNGLIATNTYGEIDNVSLSFSGNHLISKTKEAGIVLHVYLRDIQGGVLAVYNTAGSQMEQIVETYPYGMPHSSGTLPEVDVNRRWFGGKEFTAESGVNLYDFNARWLNPALAMFTTPDPLAFNTPDVSPYTFCAGDPINYSDPTGEVIIFINGFHWGDGGKSEYWEGVDKIIMKGFKDYKAIYYDGSTGGGANMAYNTDHKYREFKGYRQGITDAAEIFKNLNTNETIKIVTHSMGAAYAKGFIKGLQSIDFESSVSHILLELDLAPYGSLKQSANPYVQTINISHPKDFFAGKSQMKNLNENIVTHINRPKESKFDAHRITSFVDDLSDFFRKHIYLSPDESD